MILSVLFCINQISMHRCTLCLKKYESSILYREHWRKVLCTSAIPYLFLRNFLGSSCHIMKIILNSATLQMKLISAFSLSKNI